MTRSLGRRSWSGPIGVSRGHRNCARTSCKPLGVVERLGEAPEPFIERIKEQPLVQIALEVAHGV